ncbi:MAG TPA: preprotein translocase subunit SecY [Spirochaetota bacterium]|nr:preprotein translocase subunit SecY [Spirochaetota bacterium]
MANVITNIFKAKDIRNRVLFTLWVLVVYRLGAHIPIPGIDVEALNQVFDSFKGAAGTVVNYFDLFAGGAFKRFTIFSLGIMPYISASIIMQLLTIVFPYFEKLKKEGSEGQKKIQKYTKYFTVVLCLFQSVFIARMLQGLGHDQGIEIVSGGSTVFFFILCSITITTGTMVLMWLGEQITEKGIGNGISMIIYAGIIVRFPAAIAQTMQKIFSKGEPIVAMILVVMFFGVVAASILLTLGRRNIPVQYGSRQIQGRSVSAAAQNLPIPVNAAGVIPIIFAVAIMQFPSQLSQMFSVDKSGILSTILFYLSPGQIPYYLTYTALLVFFCFFYAPITFNPTDVADALKKRQGFIPGLRPGSSTTEYLSNVLYRLTLSGSLFLAFIALIPDFILKMWPDEISAEMAFMFGGTSLLIIVGVALDTLKNLESHLIMRHYDGFFKNMKIKSRRQ